MKACLDVILTYELRELCVCLLMKFDAFEVSVNDSNSTNNFITQFDLKSQTDGSTQHSCENFSEEREIPKSTSNDESLQLKSTF